MTTLAWIHLDHYHSRVQKTKRGEYRRITRWFFGKKASTHRISDLEAARLAAYSDWKVTPELAAAKAERYPVPALLAAMEDL